MKSEGGADDAKRRAGESAAELVEDGMVVGLGTGSTAAYAIKTIGRKVDAGMNVRGIPTSYQSRQLAREVGIPLVTLDDTLPDLAIDGADQVADGVLVKGGGAAHAREKIVDASATRFVSVIDETKRTDTLDHPIPVEVLPSAIPTVEQSLREEGGEPTLRSAKHKDGPVITDNGNPILDCAFGTIDDPDALATSLSAIPGVVEHGIFTDITDEIHIGSSHGVDIQTV
jgi:ribose 5-phosphate isomerase A